MKTNNTIKSIGRLTLDNKIKSLEAIFNPLNEEREATLKELSLVEKKIKNNTSECNTLRRDINKLKGGGWDSRSVLSEYGEGGGFNSLSDEEKEKKILDLQETLTTSKEELQMENKPLRKKAKEINQLLDDGFNEWEKAKNNLDEANKELEEKYVSKELQLENISEHLITLKNLIYYHQQDIKKLEERGMEIMKELNDECVELNKANK